jgi:ketosteroid isomerase-like protein
VGAALDTVRRVLAAFDAGDDDGLTALLAEDMILEAPGGVLALDRAGAKRYVAGFTAAFGELAVDTHLLVEQGDLVVEEYTMTATHVGRYLLARGEALAPTGVRITLRVAEVYRVRDGRVVENRLYFDETRLLDQLGVAR